METFPLENRKLVGALELKEPLRSVRFGPDRLGKDPRLQPRRRSRTQSFPSRTRKARSHLSRQMARVASDFLSAQVTMSCRRRKTGSHAPAARSRLILSRAK